MFKNFIDFIRNIKNKKEIKQLPEVSSWRAGPKIKQVDFTRADKSCISLIPIYKNDLQDIFVITDLITGKKTELPKYEFKQTNSKYKNINNKILLIDMSAEELKDMSQNLKFHNFIANVFLSEERIYKIITEHHGYAGRVVVDKKGNPYKTRFNGVEKALRKIKR